MEKESNETKYQKLASEYSKVRSQAAVLKKALLDEQIRNNEITELVKKHEQYIRKRDQEIDSLIFRNEQLTKRITVLQQDLQNSSVTKKNKGKPAEVSFPQEIDVLNEEFQKKIVENVQLFNTIAEKDLDIFNYKEEIKKLKDDLSSLQRSYKHEETWLKEEEKYKTEIKKLQHLVDQLSNNSLKGENVTNENKEECEEDNSWKCSTGKRRPDSDLLRNAPNSHDKLYNYYELQLSKMLDKNILLQSELNISWAENISLKDRLEQATSEFCKLRDNIDGSYEELIISNKNYKSQLDAMTEHLAAQNEKITNQSEEIQILKHRLSLKK